MSNTNQISAEQRKQNREKFMIKEKQNETIFRHYGDLNGADFKLRKNIKCEIYILDWSKGMYIDDCEDCKIVVGPIDGSVFIRGSKNCEFSIIARQVRFRNCENLKVFTYCPSDPAVESSYNIYFAPFNAFFPHLKELFVKAEFKKEEKNHIDTPYDFTPGEELGGGAEHYLKLPEEEFSIKVVNDGNFPVEEMYEGYSQEEPWIQNKSSELPNFEQTENNFNFASENKNDNENEIKNNQASIQPTLNDFIIPSNNQKEDKINKNNDNNNFMNMDDFLSTNINLSDQNKQNNTFDNSNNNKVNNLNDNNNNFMDFFGDNNKNNNTSSNPKTNLDFNDDFNKFNIDNTNNNTFNNSNNFFNNNIPNNISRESEEEMKRQALINKEREMRQERIKQKMEKEAKMRMEIMRKASEYINQFYEDRKKRIALNHEKLMQAGENQNNKSSGGSPWGMVESSITGNSSNADRMKEVILNKNKDLNK